MLNHFVQVCFSLVLSMWVTLREGGADLDSGLGSDELHGLGPVVDQHQALHRVLDDERILNHMPHVLRKCEHLHAIKAEPPLCFMLHTILAPVYAMEQWKQSCSW